ncbi:DNA-directed RNA polymerase subunit K [Candidatus Bathyarchaeota archaeon]|nr:DNA-directed RNA polymerase subunit K [Candidatus Bathyarchaeota archaeon]
MKQKSPKGSQVLIGPPKLTRFEKARIVGARALQISMGAPVLLDLDGVERSPINIAILELEASVLPLSIKRSLPDGSSQNIPLSLLVKKEKWES